MIGLTAVRQSAKIRALNLSSGLGSRFPAHSSVDPEPPDDHGCEKDMLYDEHYYDIACEWRSILVLFKQQGSKAAGKQSDNQAWYGDAFQPKHNSPQSR